MPTQVKRGGRAVSRRGRALSKDMPAGPPPLKDTMKMHAESAARSVMEAHPLHKQMRADMHRALMGVARGARGPAAMGRRTGIFS